MLVFKHTFRKSIIKNIIMENNSEMQVIEIDDLTLVEKVNLLYSIFRSTFEHQIVDEPEIKKTSWKIKYLIAVFLKMYNSDD